MDTNVMNFLMGAGGGLLTAGSLVWASASTITKLQETVRLHSEKFTELNARFDKYVTENNQAHESLRRECDAKATEVEHQLDEHMKEQTGLWSTLQHTLGEIHGTLRIGRQSHP